MRRPQLVRSVVLALLLAGLLAAVWFLLLMPHATTPTFVTGHG